MDRGPPGSFVHGIFQARILEWVATSSPGDLPTPGIEPSSPVSPALAGRSLPLSHLRSPDLLTVCLSSLMASSTSAPGHFLGTARLQVTAWRQPVTYRNIVCSLKPPPSFSFRTISTGIWANVLSLDSRGLCN